MTVYTQCHRAEGVSQYIIAGVGSISYQNVSLIFFPCAIVHGHNLCRTWQGETGDQLESVTGLCANNNNNKIKNTAKLVSALFHPLGWGSVINFGG